MTTRITRMTTALGAGLLGVLADTPATAAQTGVTITATVGELRNHKGSVHCSLHATGEGFPGSKPMATASVTTLEHAFAVCTFVAVPPGTYAIAVLHDENNNGKLDTNWLGIPSEGYGASNNRWHTFSAPTFDESRFVVARSDVALAIKLKY